MNWSQVAWFLGLSFGLSWLVDLALYLNSGLTSPIAKLLMRFQMLMPAFSALILGSALYAAYHIGYGMPASEMVFLFFIGAMYAVVFRLTKDVFILWPVFQPMGQLVTLVKDG